MMELLSACGYASLPKFTEKEELVKMIARYEVLDKPRSALEQFKEGLSTLDVLHVSSTMPPVWSKFHARRVDLARRVDAAWILCYKFSPPVGFTRFSLPPGFHVHTNTSVPPMTSLSRTQKKP